MERKKSQQAKLTPAQEDEPSDLGLLHEDGDGQNEDEVEAFVEEPHDAGQQDVVEQGEEQLALPVLPAE